MLAGQGRARSRLLWYWAAAERPATDRATAADGGWLGRFPWLAQRFERGKAPEDALPREYCRGRVCGCLLIWGLE